MRSVVKKEPEDMEGTWRMKERKRFEEMKIGERDRSVRVKRRIVRRRRAEERGRGEDREWCKQRAVKEFEMDGEGATRVREAGSRDRWSGS